MMVNMKLVVSGLRELSDRSYQWSVWLARVPSLSWEEQKISSIEEAKSRVFLDSGLNIPLTKMELVFSIGIDAKLIKLWQTCDALELGVKTAVDIDSMKMEEVRRLSAELLEELPSYVQTVNALVQQSSMNYA